MARCGVRVFLSSLSRQPRRSISRLSPPAAPTRCDCDGGVAHDATDPGRGHSGTSVAGELITRAASWLVVVVRPATRPSAGGAVALNLACANIGHGGVVVLRSSYRPPTLGRWRRRPHRHCFFLAWIGVLRFWSHRSTFPSALSRCLHSGFKKRAPRAIKEIKAFAEKVILPPPCHPPARDAVFPATARRHPAAFRPLFSPSLSLSLSLSRAFLRTIRSPAAYLCTSLPGCSVVGRGHTLR